MPATRPKKCTEMKLASLPLQQEMAMDESTTAKQKCLSLSLNATMAAICEDDPHTFMLTLLPRCMCNLPTNAQVSLVQHLAVSKLEMCQGWFKQPWHWKWLAPWETWGWILFMFWDAIAGTNRDRKESSGPGTGENDRAVAWAVTVVCAVVPVFGTQEPTTFHLFIRLASWEACRNLT